MKLLNRTHFIKNATLLFCFLIVQLFLINNSKAQVDFIVAKVNNSAITNSELKSRVRLFVKISGFKNQSKRDNEILSDAILSKMIEEELVLQEAKKLAIDVTKEEVEDAIKIITLSQKDNYANIANFFKHNQMEYKSFWRQVESEVLWSRIVSIKLKPTISVSELEINEMLERANLLKEEKQLNISEISIDVKDSNIVKKIHDELVSGADFDQIARNFSQSYTSEDRGSLGWVNKSQLNEAIFSELERLKKGQYSRPILLGNYYRIFRINNIKIDKDVSEQDLERVKNYLSNNKLRIKSKSYLMNLKRSAFIEIE